MIIKFGPSHPMRGAVPRGIKARSNGRVAVIDVESPPAVLGAVDVRHIEPEMGHSGILAFLVDPLTASEPEGWGGRFSDDRGGGRGGGEG
jgi:hypothetical protein